MYSPRQKIFWFAFCSRMTVLVLQFLANVLIPDHDAGVFTSPEDPGLRKTSVDVVVDKIFGGLKRWDAQYFIHIAQYGYTYENCLAFFPAFPVTVRYIGFCLNNLFYSILNLHSQFLIAAVIMNFVIFLKTADVLYRLSVRVLRNESRAYKATILFCINPASIFFSAPYSESLFALMTFLTMLKCTDSESLRFANINILSGVPAAITLVTRSNGIVNLGFIMYASLKNVLERTIPEIVYKYKTIKHKVFLPFLTLPLFASSVALMMTLLVALLPFYLVQVYNYFKFCVPHDHKVPEFLFNNDYVIPGTATSPWCNDTLPLSYNYVQTHYWDVGLFKYYKIKQIPNFILAAPILAVILSHCISYIKHNYKICFKLGIKMNGEIEKMPYSRQYNKDFINSDRAMFVYVVHALVLTIFCILFVHIQVSTRLLASASPILYWICSYRINLGTPTIDQNAINEHFRRLGVGKRIPSHYLLIANLEGVDNMYSRWRTFIVTRRMPDLHSRLVQYYFIGYFVIGTILFSNFLPWT